MPKTIAFQDGERRIFVTIHPLTQVLVRRVADKMRRKEGIRITDQSDLYEKLQLSDAMLREIIDSVEIQNGTGDRKAASSIDVNELFFSERTNPRALVLEEAGNYAKEGDAEVKRIEGN